MYLHAIVQSDVPSQLVILSILPIVYSGLPRTLYSITLQILLVFVQLSTSLARPSAERALTYDSRLFKSNVRLRDLGEVVAWNFGPIWDAPVSIGGQEFVMLIDTGSSDL